MATHSEAAIRRLRGMLERWLETADSISRRTNPDWCELCLSEGGHRADCPVPPTRALLREHEAAAGDAEEEAWP